MNIINIEYKNLEIFKLNELFSLYFKIFDNDDMTELEKME